MKAGRRRARKSLLAAATLALLSLILLALPASSLAGSCNGTLIGEFTAAGEHSVEVPAGVKNVCAEVVGNTGGGQRGSELDPFFGNSPGLIEAIFPVTPKSTLHAFVNGGGGLSNGGGLGAGGNGGGASALWVGSELLAVAGGGGGTGGAERRSANGKITWTVGGNAGPEGSSGLNGPGIGAETGGRGGIAGVGGGGGGRAGSVGGAVGKGGGGGAVGSAGFNPSAQGGGGGGVGGGGGGGAAAGIGASNGAAGGDSGSGSGEPDAECTGCTGGDGGAGGSGEDKGAQGGGGLTTSGLEIFGAGGGSGSGQGVFDEFQLGLNGGGGGAGYGAGGGGGGTGTGETTAGGGGGGANYVDVAAAEPPPGSEQVINATDYAAPSQSAVVRITTAVSQVSLTPHSHDFPPTEVSNTSSPETFMLTNEGVETISIVGIKPEGSDFADFESDASNCEGNGVGQHEKMLKAHESCTIKVWFKPTEAGHRGSGLHANTSVGEPVSVLTGEGTPKGGGGVAEPRMSPELLNFETQPLDTTSEVGKHVLTVRNAGDADLMIKGTRIEGPNEKDFKDNTANCTGKEAGQHEGVLEPGDHCTIDVTFTPSLVEAESAELFLETTNGEPHEVHSKLAGTGTAAVLALSPTSNTFGPIPVNTSEEESFRLKNNGNETSNIETPEIVGKDQTQFKISDNKCGTTLEGGHACMIKVAFSPLSEGPFQAELEVKGDGGPVKSLLFGLTETPTATLTPTEGNFEKVGVGTKSGPKPFTLKNTSTTASLTVEKVDIEPVGEEKEFEITTNECKEPAKSPLAPGASCLIEVAFTPQTPGVKEASLVAHTSAGAIPSTLKGEGVTGVISLKPSEFNFKAQEINELPGSERGEFKIENTGEAPFTVTKVGLADTVDRKQFSFEDTEECEGKTLKPKEVCEVRVGFIPTEEGDKETRLAVESTVGPASSKITGEGTKSDLVIEPTFYPFEEVEPGDVSKPFAFEVTNLGTAPVKLGSASLIPRPKESSLEFGKGADTCSGQTLEKEGGTCEVQVVFEPFDDGDWEALLRLPAVEGQSQVLEAIVTGHSGKGIAEISPSFEDFGTEVEGGESSPHTFTVKNAGDGPLHIVGVEAGGNASLFGTAETTPIFQVDEDKCTGGTLAPGESCNVTVTFDPVEVGRRGGYLVVETEHGGTPFSALAGEGTL